MKVGVIGDVHGDFSTIERIMKANSEIKCWLCTGDLADETMEYFSPPAPLYWISGNHENWDKIEKGIKSVCLDKPKTSWIKLDTESFRIERIVTESHFSGGF